ncbi:MAG: triose-phosphate isomerase [Anaerolineae bacterium]|nr:triose-phosphate isomerase [Anaerolineae bacterium]
MRTPIIAGNWKMHKTLDESVAFVRELAPRLEPFAGVERVVCPTFVSLAAAADALRGTPIKVGAQNVSHEEKGAFTSQIAPDMLAGLVEYVIIGHSECRQYLGETDELINKKAHAALNHGLKPIIAVGESLQQREAGEALPFVERQVRAALADISAEQMAQVVIAYEPIWAIGTGLNASVADAAEVCGHIRSIVRDIYGDAVAGALRIQYGGSVKPGNMLDYMGAEDIDGALVGGASLKVDDFTTLVELAAQAKGV